MIRTLAAALAFSAISSVASASVVGLTGNVVELSPAPLSVNNSIPGNDTTAYVFEEQTIWLTSDLVTDTGTISAGQWVTSYMLFMNQVSGPPQINTSASGTVSFTDAILGLMTSSANMINSSGLSALLGASGTNYNLTHSLTGLENNDSLTFSGNVATFAFNVNEPGDWTRVITVATIPLPAGGLLLLGALGGLATLRRRRNLV